MNRMLDRRHADRAGAGLRLLGSLAAAPLAAAGAWIGYSSIFIPRRLRLPPAVSGERRNLDSRVGQLSYYVAGPAEGAEPLLLVHSVNAAGSAYEVRPLYERYRLGRRVYALDLLGFGCSERVDRTYTPSQMTDAIHAMVGEIRRIHGGLPIDALALSLSSEFLARAAAETPGAFRSLALVSPTGFGRPGWRKGRADKPRAMPSFRNVLAFPFWSRAFFDLLTSRPSIRFFLEKTWGSKKIDEGLLDYDYLTTHQPGAQHAPYSFVSGLLFSADIRRIYASLQIPVWMAHGVRGDFTDYAGKHVVEGKPNWTIKVFSTGALPHFEVLDEFAHAYDAFLARVP